MTDFKHIGISLILGNGAAIGMQRASLHKKLIMSVRSGTLTQLAAKHLRIYHQTSNRLEWTSLIPKTTSGTEPQLSPSSEPAHSEISPAQQRQTPGRFFREAVTEAAQRQATGTALKPMRRVPLPIDLTHFVPDLAQDRRIDARSSSYQRIPPSPPFINATPPPQAGPTPPILAKAPPAQQPVSHTLTLTRNSPVAGPVPPPSAAPSRGPDRVPQGFLFSAHPSRVSQSPVSLTLNTLPLRIPAPSLKLPPLQAAWTRKQAPITPTQSHASAARNKDPIKLPPVPTAWGRNQAALNPARGDGASTTDTSLGRPRPNPPKSTPAILRINRSRLPAQTKLANVAGNSTNILPLAAPPGLPPPGVTPPHSLGTHALPSLLLPPPDAKPLVASPMPIPPGNGQPRFMMIRHLSTIRDPFIAPAPGTESYRAPLPLQAARDSGAIPLSSTDAPSGNLESSRASDTPGGQEDQENDVSPAILQGDLFLDGHLLASWVAHHIAREASLPPRSGRQFNTRIAPAWPGMPL